MKKFIFFLFLFLIPVSYANLGFFGSEISTQNINSGENLEVNSTIINRENLVKSEIEVVYELRRLSDMSLFYENIEVLSFAPYEVKKLKESISFGNIPNGEYKLNLIIRSGSGSPLSFLAHDLVVENSFDALHFSTLPYLKIFYEYKDGRTRFEKSYSNTGKPIVPNSDFEVHFSLKNDEFSSKDYDAKLFLRHSYSTQELREIYSEHISVEAGENNFTIIHNMNKSGTYDMFVKVFDNSGKIVANKEVRVVIMGQGGTITDVFNKQDTYENGEIAELMVSLVGPADAVSVVNDAFLKMQIIKDENILDEKIINIDKLPFNLETYSFSFDVEHTLDYYTVKTILGKEDLIYDEVELSYEPLTPELIISPDGRIYNPSRVGCFDDNICTDEEKSVGNCFDCIAPKKESENDSLDLQQETSTTNDSSNKDYIYALAVILVAGVSVIALRRLKKNEK